MNEMAVTIQQKLPKIYSKDLMEELFRLPYTKRGQLEKAGLKYSGELSKRIRKSRLLKKSK
jgi:Txe/YoeB family toxin of Txe-Axe toxin-antitoxin module